MNPETISAPRSAWIRVADAVRNRRKVELQLTHKDVEAFDGPSTFTISQIENVRARGYRASTLAKLEDALDWPKGYIAELLAEPTPAPVAGPKPALARFAGIDSLGHQPATAAEAMAEAVAGMADDVETARICDTPLDEITSGDGHVIRFSKPLTVGAVVEAIQLLQGAGLANVAEHLARQPILVAV